MRGEYLRWITNDETKNQLESNSMFEMLDTCFRSCAELQHYCAETTFSKSGTYTVQYIKYSVGKGWKKAALFCFVSGCLVKLLSSFITNLKNTYLFTVKSSLHARKNLMVWSKCCFLHCTI